jgi:hypothetical protein
MFPFIAVQTRALGDVVTNSLEHRIHTIEDNLTAMQLQAATNDLSFKLRIMQDQLAEVRRDQLDHRLEKDLLKETYSSNLQILNLILALILALFTILGFLGLRDLSSTRREYSTELENLRKLRSEFETKIAELAASQKSVQEQHAKLTAQSESQNQRIQILEIQEKASLFFSTGNYKRALQYADAGLAVAPKDTTLLSVKATALFKAHDLAPATTVYRELLAIDPGNQSTITNFAELLLLQNQIDDFRSFFANNKAIIDGYCENAHLSTYLQFLESYQTNALDDMRTLATKFFSTAGTENKKHLGNWQFDDLEYVVARHPDSVKKTILLAFLRVLKGELTPPEAKAIIDAA